MVPPGSVIIGVCVNIVGVGMGAAAILLRVVRSGCQGRGDAVLAGHEEHQLAPSLCSRVLLRQATLLLLPTTARATALRAVLLMALVGRKAFRQNEGIRHILQVSWSRLRGPGRPPTATSNCFLCEQAGWWRLEVAGGGGLAQSGRQAAAQMRGVCERVRCGGGTGSRSSGVGHVRVGQARVACEELHEAGRRLQRLAVGEVLQVQAEHAHAVVRLQLGGAAVALAALAGGRGAVALVGQRRYNPARVLLQQGLVQGFEVVVALVCDEPDNVPAVGVAESVGINAVEVILADRDADLIGDVLSIDEDPLYHVVVERIDGDAHKILWRGRRKMLHSKPVPVQQTHRIVL
jgi:hypothetical protein